MKFLKIILLLVILIFPLALNVVSAQGNVISSFNPSSVTAGLNQDFTLNIQLTPSATLAVRAYQIDLSFNTSKTQVKSITYKVGRKSAILGGQDTNDIVQINSSGQIRLIGEIAEVSPFTLTQAGVTSFVEIVFNSKSQDQYPINIVSSSFLKNVKPDLSLEQLPISPSSSTVNQASSAPQVNLQVKIKNEADTTYASSKTVASATAVTLKWVVTNTAISCTAAGDWSGGKDAAGSTEDLILTNTSTNANITKTFNISCANTSGSSPQSTATVIVTTRTPTSLDLTVNNSHASSINTAVNTVVTFAGTLRSNVSAAPVAIAQLKVYKVVNGIDQVFPPFVQTDANGQFTFTRTFTEQDSVRIKVKFEGDNILAPTEDTRTINVTQAPPSPTPTPPPPPPACSKFAIQGLTDTGLRNTQGGIIYEIGSVGGNKQVDMAFTPANAQVNFTITKEPRTAADLIVTQTNTGTEVSRVVNVPPNTSSANENIYQINTSITSGGSTVNCVPVNVKVSKVAVPLGTGCYLLADNPITATACTDAGARAYDTHPKIEPITLTTAGRKTIFVRFISNLGQTRDFQRVVNFNPDPSITEVTCTHSLSGSGSIVTISGTALGSRGRGKVKVAGEEANIISWNEQTGVITASLENRLQGKIDVEVIRNDGKLVHSECTVGTTSVQFLTQTQCKIGNLSENNVLVKIFDNAPATATIETEKRDPVISERVKVDKDGKPTGFIPKLEKNKKYSLLVKAPGTLAKRVDFETKGGTRNLENITLLVGDIAPAANADGKINAFDRAELIRQWSLVRDVQRSADFNQDGRVNAVDYACMRQNINQSDDEFSPSLSQERGITPSPTATASASPTATSSAVPTATVSATPAAGGLSGILPFRISFDPSFATIVASGDMGNSTTFIQTLTLNGGSGLKSVYVQFFENGVWGPVPPQTANINLR